MVATKQERREVGRRHRTRKQETLDEIAFQVGQHVELLLVFDAFRHGRRTDRTGEVDHCAHEGERCGRVVDLLDEGLVDLDGVDGERVQVTER